MSTAGENENRSANTFESGPDQPPAIESLASMREVNTSHNDREFLDVLSRCSKGTMEDALRLITNEACALVGGEGGSIWLRDSTDPTRIVLRWTYSQTSENDIGKAFYTNHRREDGYYDGLTGWVFATGESLFLRDITDKKEADQYDGLLWTDKHEGFRRLDVGTQALHRNFIAVPIFSCRARRDVIAVLRISSAKTSEGLRLDAKVPIQALASQISGILTNHLKLEEERSLLRSLLTLAGRDTLEAFLQEIARCIPVVLDGSDCSIFLIGENNTLCLEATSSHRLRALRRSEAKKDCLKYELGEGKTGRVGRFGESIRESGDIRSNSQAKSPEQCECQDETAAYLCTAIRAGDDAPVGVIRVVRSAAIAHEFDSTDQEFLEQFSRSLFSALDIRDFFRKASCFVVMPIGGEASDKLYFNVIKPAVEELGFLCLREDEYPAGEHLQSIIVQHIQEARFVIAEITGLNRNVYYELGIAHALEKPVILLSQDDPASDVHHVKYIRYKDQAGYAPQIKDDIRKAVEAAVKSGHIRANLHLSLRPTGSV